jgi:hypothetical protein
MNDNEFYDRVSLLLNVEHDNSAFPYYRRTRWNNRTPGRGRFPGHGIVRCFGSEVHVSLHTPSLNGIYGSREIALEAIALRLREASGETQFLGI